MKHDSVNVSQHFQEQSTTRMVSVFQGLVVDSTWIYRMPLCSTYTVSIYTRVLLCVYNPHREILLRSLLPYQVSSQGKKKLFFTRSKGMIGLQVNPWS